MAGVEERRERLVRDRGASVLAPCTYMLKALRDELYPVSARRGLTVSTIHGAKGSEADVVFVIPDVALRLCAGRKSVQDRLDDLVRLFYVAFTRTREELVLLAPATERSIDWI